MPEIPYCDRPAPAPRHEGMEADVFDLVNQARTEAGLGALVLNDILIAEARKQAQRCAETGNMEAACHDICGTVKTRVQKAGYRLKLISENLSSRRTASAVVEGWKASRVHHTNMYGAAYEDTGVGVVMVNDLLVTCQIYGDPAEAEETSGNEVEETA